MWSVFIKKDDDWCLCHPRGWKYKHLLFTICTKFVCMFELGCIICLTLNQKNKFNSLAPWNERSQLLTSLTSLPISCGCFHRAWVHTLSLTFLCVFVQSDCVLACLSRAGQAYVSSCFFEKCKHIYSVFRNEFVYYSVCLSLLDLRSVLHWNKNVSGMSGSEMWNAQMQALHVNLLESSSA